MKPIFVVMATNLLFCVQAMAAIPSGCKITDSRSQSVEYARLSVASGVCKKNQQFSQMTITNTDTLKTGRNGSYTLSTFDKTEDADQYRACVGKWAKNLGALSYNDGDVLSYLFNAADTIQSYDNYDDKTREENAREAVKLFCVQLN